MVRTGLAVGGAALVLVGGAALTWGGGGFGGHAEAQGTDLREVGSVRLDTGSGDVAIEHVPGAQPRVVQRVHHGWFGGWSREDETVPQHELNGTDLVLSGHCGWNCSVSYEVVLPEPVAVTGHVGSGSLDVLGMSEIDTETGSGSMTVRDIEGDVRVKSGSGDVTVSRVRGAVDAETSSGNVDVQDVEGPTVRAHTGSGNVEVDAVSGRLDLETGSGEVSGRDLRAQGLRASTGSGNVQLALLETGEVDASTSSGGVELTVPRAPYRVEAETGSGEKSIEVPQDPAARTLLRVSTGSGNLEIAAR